MTWTDPVTLSQSFDTNDIPTEGNFDSLFNNLLALLHPYDAALADVDVANTVTETSLWSKVIAANDLGANGWAYLRVDGDVLSNAAGSVILRVKFGGVTHIVSNSFPPTTQNSATRQPWRIDLRLCNRAATNSQLLIAEYICSQPGATTGLGQIGTTQSVGTALTIGILHNTGAIDTTVAQTFDLTVQWSAASVNSSFRKRVAVLLLGQN